ncbi:hypothetical protein ES703_32261 [subsurface metagenome]
MKIKLEKKDVGFGRYQWYIDNEVCELPECDIFDMFTDEQQKRIISQMNYYGHVNLEFEI